MSYLNAAVPADSEAVTLGASRIRTLEADLNNLIEQVWDDTGIFKSGWIIAGGAVGGASLFTPGAIQQDDIGDGQVGTAQLAESAVTDDKIAPGIITADKLDPEFIAPANSVATSSCQSGFLSADGSGRALMAPGFILPAALGFAFLQASVGNYAGSNSVSQAITGLAFTPNVAILTGGGNQGIGFAFLSEAVGGVSPIHASWINTPIVSPFVSGIQWQPNGFIVAPTNFDFNKAGNVHTYIALVI